MVRATAVTWWPPRGSSWAMIEHVLIITHA